MHRRRREMQQARVFPQESKVYFNIEAQFTRQCAICYRPNDTLIRPCECSTGYHEQCLLLYLQKRITQTIQERQQMDVSNLKCMTCQHRFYILFRHSVERSCGRLCQRLSKNCCNIYIILLGILLIVMIVTAVLTAIFLRDETSSKGVKYGLITAVVIEGLAFLSVLYGFLQNYMSKRQFVLQKVYDMTDLRSMESQNSQQNKVNENQQVVIKP